MRRLIPNLPFSENDFYPCGPVALDAMLQFYGYSTPLVIHGQWFFAYQQNENDSFEISSRLTPIQSDLQRRGVRVKEHQEPDAETAWKNAKSRIENGRPVPALADTHYLEALYYPGLGHHSEHSVILAGYDDGSNTVHVVDPSPTKRFRGDLPLSGFKVAWGSEHIKRYVWMEFHLSEPRWKLTPEQAGRIIQQNVSLMLYGKTSQSGAYIGLNGLRTLSDDLAQWKEQHSDQSRNYLKQLYDHLQFVVMERDGHAEFLNLVADILNQQVLSQVGDQLSEITQKWIVFRNLCFKGQKKALKQTLEKLHGRLEEIAALEQQALVRLEELIARGPLFC